MLLTFSLALLAQTPQSPIAPPAVTKLPQAPKAAASAQQGSPALQPGQSVGDGMLGTSALESFETPNIGVGGVLSTTGETLDETSILSDGQGPNMVLGGCSYTSSGGQFQLHGATYFGMPSQTITGFPSSTVVIDYDYAQSSVSLALNAFDGYPDTAEVMAYDAGGNLVASVTGINLPDAATQVPVVLSGAGIKKIEVTSTIGQGWSPLIDDHNYSTEPGAFELFEAPTIAVGNAIVVGGPVLDDTTVLSNGEGPGMVEDGCTYGSTADIQWNGQDWFGQTSETILAVGGGPLTLTYDYVQNGVSFTLNAFETYPDTVDVTAFDSGGAVIQTVSGIALPTDASQVAVNLSANGIKRVEIGVGVYGWSGLLDNHDYLDAPPAIDLFEGYQLLANGAEVTNASELTAATIANGQGPGLVAPNVTYSAGGGLFQWNNRGYFGQATKNVNTNGNGGLLEIHYDSTQSSVNFTLAAFEGYADTASCTAYDAHGNVVDSVGGIAIAGPNPVAVSLSSASGISRVAIQGSYSWSPLFDHSGYTGSDYALSMTLTGPCPGVQTAAISGGRPGAVAKLMYSNRIGGSLIPFGACTGTPTELAGNIKLLNPTFRYDANGEINFSNFTPAAACGRIFIQLVDIDCNLSNVIAL